MFVSHRLFAAALAGLLALAPGLSADAQAQDPTPVIDVSGSVKAYPLAWPVPVDPTGTAAAEAEAIWAVVKRDLELTGWFQVIDRDAYLDKSTNIAPGTFTFDDWKLIRALVLAKSSVRREGEELVIDLYVYDVTNGGKLTGKRFRGGLGETRYLAHKVADEILLAATGERGFFSARLVAVGAKGGNKEVYLMDLDGQGITPVSQNGSINLSPAWSPDGGQVAWTSYKRGNPDVFVKDLRGGRVRVVANRPGINSGAAWSPDGTKIALAQSDDGDSDIWIIDSQTGVRLQQLTKGGGIDVAPSWSPDGTKIAFASERSGGSQIYVADVATGAAKRVTFQGDFNFDPVFSPDGSKIVFVGRDRRFDIFVVGADGRGLARITQDQGDNEDPAWSADGRYLVFGSTRTGRSEIWMSTADGRHQVQISQGGGWTQPSWSPR